MPSDEDCQVRLSSKRHSNEYTWKISNFLHHLARLLLDVFDGSRPCSQPILCHWDRRELSFNHLFTPCRPFDVFDLLSRLVLLHPLLLFRLVVCPDRDEGLELGVSM